MGCYEPTKICFGCFIISFILHDIPFFVSLSCLNYIYFLLGGRGMLFFGINGSEIKRAFSQNFGISGGEGHGQPLVGTPFFLLISQALWV